MHINQKQMLDIANIVLCKYCFCAKCKSLNIACKMKTWHMTVFLRMRIQMHSWLNFISVALSDHNVYQSPVSYIKVAKVITYMKPKTTQIQYIIES